MKRIALAALAMVVLVACSDTVDLTPPTTTRHDEQPTTTLPEETTTTRAPSNTTTTTAAPGFVTTDVSTPADTDQGVLTDVTVGAHDGFVRVVFTFSNLVPGYSVKKAEPPFHEDGSGNSVAVNGEGHLAVRLTARAHSEDGKPTVSKRTAGPSGTALKEVVMTGDFEGVVNFVIGMTEQKPFKVFTLKSPARLVVDIQSP